MSAGIGPLRTSASATGAAVVTIGVALVSLVAALAGLEALGLLFAGALALLLLTPAIGRLHTRGLVVSPPPPGYASVAVTHALTLEVENRSRWFAARDLLVSVDDGRRAPAPATGHVTCLAPGERTTITTAPRHPRRGRVPNLRVTLRSSFPFGLGERTLDFALPCDLLVLPRVGRLGPIERRLARLGGEREDAPRGAQSDGEFYGLREWREGESLRRVHWKLSARRGRLLLRELVAEDRPTIRLVLSTWVETALASRPAPSFERAVSLAATLAEHFLRRGQPLTLVLAGPDPTSVEPRRGRPALLEVLAALAEVRHVVGPASLAFDTPLPAERLATTVFVLAGGRAGERRALAPPGAWVLDVDDESGVEVYEGMRAARSRAPSHETVAP